MGKKKPPDREGKNNIIIGPFRGEIKGERYTQNVRGDRVQKRMIKKIDHRSGGQLKEAN